MTISLTDPFTVGSASHGTTSINSGGVTVTYTPSAGYTGPDSFTFTASDGTYSASATVNVTVTQVPLPPVVFNPPSSGALSSGESQSVVLSVPGYPNATISYMLNGDGVWKTYSSAFNLTRDTVITAYANQSGFSQSGLSSQEFVNPLAPIAAAGYFTVNETFAGETPQQNVLDVLANDTDSEGLGLAISVGTQPANGVASIDSNGNLNYAPNAGFSGIDTFSYIITGHSGIITGSGYQSKATVTVFVQNNNDNPPNASDVTYTLAPFVYNATFNVLALGSDNDPDGNALSLYVVSPPQKGTVALNSLGQITYTRTTTPNVLFGSDTFSYIITDGLGGFATADVIVPRQQNLWVDSSGSGSRPNV